MNPKDNKIQFSMDFERMLNASLKIYDGALDKLQDLVGGKSFDEGYGVCNTRYQLIQITPKDVSTYVSNLFRAIAFRLIESTPDDLEKFSVEMAKQFVLENGGPKLAADNLFATSTYVDVRTQTLMDILVQTENTFFDRSVYSTYELKQRAADMKKDFDSMKGMRLGVSLNAVVKALPGIIQQQLQEPGFGCCCTNIDMLMQYIQTFILFVVSLNACTIEQMIGYIAPRTTFVRKDKPGTIQEATVNRGVIDTANYKPVFVIVSSGEAPWDPLIKGVTKSQWTHCSLSFDPDLEKIYSYASRLFDDKKLKFGMVKENFGDPNYKGTTVAVYALYISNESYNKMREACEKQYEARDKTIYDFGLLFKKALNDNTVGSKNEMKKFCSSFVNDMLRMCGKGLSSKYVPSPAQMANSAEAMPDKCVKVFDGIADNYDVHRIEKRLKKFEEKELSRAFYEASVDRGVIDSTGYKPVFVIVTSGKALWDPLIKHFTRSDWTHCSLSFDSDMSSMYSYGARLQDDPKHPNKFSLKREGLEAPNIKGMNIAVYALYVTNESYNKMRETCERMYAERDKTIYDFALLLKKAFNDNTAGSKNDMKKICSSFVNDMIKLCGKGVSDKYVPSPAQMAKGAEASPDKCVLVFDGVSDNYNVDKVDARLHKFEKKEISKPFVEYYTECCLVDTDDIRIRSKIPFDINMKNIVLQDVTNGFKETKTALHFMLKDERSPIHNLLMKYATCKRLANAVEVGPTLNLFRPYFNRGYDPVVDQYRKMSFDTDLNWLDEIAYGNQFLDGNYRLDALGHEARHPITQTLAMLHKMYCGCGLKSNEEISNNLLKIAGAMHAVICDSWSVENRDLTRDILAVLGDCFTRNAIRLYHNNTVLIVHDDTMEDTVVPGYMYIEQFVYQEDGEQSVKPNIQAGFGDKLSNVAQKTGALSKVSSLIRQFETWLTNSFAKFPALFAARNKAIAAHLNSKNVQDVQKEIGAAMSASGPNQFIVKLTGIPKFKIDVQSIIKNAQAAPDVYKKYIDGQFSKNPIDDKAEIDIRANIFPGNADDWRNFLNGKPSDKDIEARIKNALLFSNPNADAVTRGADPNPVQMDTAWWNDIIQTLTGTQKLLDEFTKAAKDSNTAIDKLLEGYSKKQAQVQQHSDVIEVGGNSIVQEAETTTAPTAPAPATGQTGQTQNTQAPQSGNASNPEDRAKQLFDINRRINDIYQTKALNSFFTREMFMVYYDVYKQIMDKYKSERGNQTTNNTTEQPAQPQKPAEQPANNNGAPTVPSAGANNAQSTTGI